MRRLKRIVNRKSLKKVVCPHCGYKMPIFFGPAAISYDVWVRCKGRNCGKTFEVITETK